MKLQYSHRSQQGFTLLEVLIALAITGMVLGSIMGIMAGSKRLAFRALHNIEETLFLRAAISSAQLSDEPKYPAFPASYTENMRIEQLAALEKPERQTTKLRYTLNPYKVSGEAAEKGFELQSLQWVQHETTQ